MTNGSVWHQHDNGSSLFKQHKGELQEGIGALIKMSSQSGYLVEQSELLFHFSEFRELWLGLSQLPTSPGLACSKTQQPHYSLDKQVWTYWTQTQNSPALLCYFLLSKLCLWLGSVCLSHSVSGCLFAWHLSGLAYFLLDLISQCEDLWRPSPHLALWISASSVPVSAVRDWLTPTQSQSSLQGPLGKSSTSPQTDSLICMPINHSQNWHPATQQGMTWSHKTQCAKQHCYVILGSKTKLGYSYNLLGDW